MTSQLRLNREISGRATTWKWKHLVKYVEISDKDNFRVTFHGDSKDIFIRREFLDTFLDTRLKDKYLIESAKYYHQKSQELKIKQRVARYESTRN